VIRTQSTSNMLLPAIHGYIDRRILVNFTADPAAIRNILPEPFTPKLYKGRAIVGICLIRLKNIKPKGLPDFLGVSSENAAHRIAVEWTDNNERREGVYIPRRDTSLKLNTLVGGRIFPGKHFLAKFNVIESDRNYHIDFTSSDHTTISLDASETDHIDPNSVFETLENASAFFEQGSVGYSPNGNRFEGLKLHSYHWKVRPLAVTSVHSSFYENEAFFPKGSILFDNALLMTRVEHEWRGLKEKPYNISKTVPAV
jgi:hypothetical protein